MDYYDAIADGYDELYGLEQQDKLAIIKGLITPDKKDWLLDVGCGSGISSNFSCNVKGIDPSKKLVKIACSKGIDAIVGYAENLPFEDSSFDYVISLTAIMNFDDISKSVTQMHRVCKKEGVCIISFLKHSQRREQILNALYSCFEQLRVIEQEKDYIIILKPL